MDPLIKVKEEPLDVEDAHDDDQLPTEAQTKELLDHGLTKIKSEIDDFDVVEEQADMITISAGEKKSEDERNFMQMFQNKPVKYLNLVAKKKTAFTILKPSKRCKVEKSKNEGNRELNYPSISVGEIQIKTEPNDYQSLLDKNIAGTAARQCYIKTELPDNKFVDTIKTEPIGESNERSTPAVDISKLTNVTKLKLKTPMHQIIRLQTRPQQPVNQTNRIDLGSLKLRIVQIPVRTIGAATASTITPAPITTMPLSKGTTITCISKPLHLQNRTSTALPLNLHGLKIVKLAPSTKIVNLTGNQPSLVPTTMPLNNNINLNNNNNINITNSNSNLNSNTNTNSITNSNTTNKTNGQAVKAEFVGTPLSIMPLNVPSNEVNSDSFMQNVLSNFDKSAPKNRNLYFQKNVIKVIESLPEKQEIIKSMRKQIETVQDAMTSSVLSTSSENSNISESSQDSYEFKQIITNSCTSNEAAVAAAKEEIEPQSYYLPVTSKHDPELWKARKEFPSYRFVWLCPHCSRHYEQKHAFRGHLVTSHGLCSEEFQKLIVEVRPFQLPVTEAATTEGRDLQAKLTCGKCGRVCSSRTMLNDHVRANCGREPQYQCVECPKKFYSASTLNCHMTIHSGELPHKCSFCAKQFRTRGQVTVHHRTHTGERPFLCQVCSQGFTHRETLISHLSRHIGMKRYKCYSCEKHFSCISGLKTHRDLRPDTCGKVKFNPRAIGPRVRVVRGNVIFEPQPEINPYLRSDSPEELLVGNENQSKD